MRRTEAPEPIWIKFCMVVDIPDVVTYTNFGDHRLRGFWVAGVKFPLLPLTFIVALVFLYYVSLCFYLRVNKDEYNTVEKFRPNCAVAEIVTKYRIRISRMY